MRLRHIRNPGADIPRSSILSATETRKKLSPRIRVVCEFLAAGTSPPAQFKVDHPIPNFGSSSR